MKGPLSASAQAYAEIYTPRTELLIRFDPEACTAEQSRSFADQRQTLMDEGLFVTTVVADETAIRVARERTSIYETFLLTPDGGIADKNARTVSLLDESEIDAIMEQGQSHPTIPVDDHILQTLRTVRALLDTTGKVAVTRADGLINEMLTREGTGTLCYHSSVLGSSPINPHEEALFRDVHQEHVESDAFRHRSESELLELLTRAYAVRIKQSPIGFFALKKYEDNWMELSAISGLLRNGSGTRIIDSAKQLAQQENNGAGMPLFALSIKDDLINFFTKNGMVHHGKTSAVKEQSHMPRFVQTYAVPGRDPHVFTWGNLQNGPSAEARES